VAEVVDGSLAGVAPRTRRTADTDVAGTLRVIGSDALVGRLIDPRPDPFLNL
jgi:hypothetical protein